jgi:hypothetical protein
MILACVIRLVVKIQDFILFPPGQNAGLIKENAKKLTYDMDIEMFLNC